jgi:type I restriction enzyme M protein
MGVDAWMQEVARLLCAPSVSREGRTMALAEYLDWVDAQVSPPRDEQEVVDPLVRGLLGALGYEQAHIAYNKTLEVGRPDYAVHLPDLLPGVCLLIVEDKATSVRDLRRKGRGGPEGAESPLDQLRRYVLGAAVYGRVGLLCNGRSLEAWEMRAEPLPLLRLDLHALARAAQAGDEAGLARFREPLQVLYGRFSRHAFEDTQREVQQILVQTRLSDEEDARLQALYAPGASRASAEQAYQAAQERQWKAHAINVAQHPDKLVEALRKLIEELSGDVAYQLSDVLGDLQEYNARLAQARHDAELDNRWRMLQTLQARFEPQAYQTHCLQRLEAWGAQPMRASVSELVLEIASNLERQVLRLGEFTPQQRAVQPSLLQDAALQPDIVLETQEKLRKDTFDTLKAELRAYAEGVVRVHQGREALAHEYRNQLGIARSWELWVKRMSSTVLVGADQAKLRAEFARQTAYVYIVRLLLVRICEDKKLFRRKLSNGGLAQWTRDAEQYLDFAAGRSYEYLTKMAYECAQNVYIHFYGASEVFDWYRMDEKMLLRTLAILNLYDLADINTDIVGTVYGRYLLEGKHEQGRYYTPKWLVELMLDTAGWQTGKVAGRRIADLSCGSGGFLVEACRRLVESYRNPTTGHIHPNKLGEVIQKIQRSVYGIDINPFACYLAEINLLIQVLDLVRLAREHNIPLAIDRFQIHCDDALTVEGALVDSLAPSSTDHDRDLPRRIKARVGEFEKGFDVIVGNPPYVRADEDENQKGYRDLIAKQPWFTTAHKKWDLYVPFVQQSLRLLSDDPDARACLITIESIATAPYAQKLRELLLQQTQLQDIIYLEKLKLFEDAAWQNNFIFSFSKPQVSKSSSPIFYRKFQNTEVIKASFEKTQRELQENSIFKFTEDTLLDLSSCVDLEEIFYVSKGMVLHSHEKYGDGDLVAVPLEYNAAHFGNKIVQITKNGLLVQHKIFKKEDLIQEHQDIIHNKPYLDSRDIIHGGIEKIHWIEYGNHARCPSLVSRPTFKELYDRKKIMFGEFTGVAVDDGSLGYIIVPHSLNVCVLWKELESINNKSLKSARKELEQAKKYNYKKYPWVSEWYVCGLALSEPIQRWLKDNKRSMKYHVYPNDIKKIPVKIISPEVQEPWIEITKNIHLINRAIFELKEGGYSIKEGNQYNVEIPAEPWFKSKMQEKGYRRLSLSDLQANQKFYIEDRFLDQPLDKAKAKDGKVYLGKEVLATLGAGLEPKQELAEVLAAFLAGAAATWAGGLSQEELPANHAHWLELREGLRAEEARVLGMLRERDGLFERLNEMAWALYRPKGERATTAPSSSEGEEDGEEGEVAPALAALMRGEPLGEGEDGALNSPPARELSALGGVKASPACAGAILDALEAEGGALAPASLLWVDDEAERG